jgi:hypothetical protein
LETPGGYLFRKQAGVHIAVNFPWRARDDGVYDTHLELKFLSRAIPVGLPCMHATVIFK